MLEIGMDIDSKVRAALANAKENGELFEGWSPGQIAVDLIQYDPDLEDADFVELADTVHAVRLGY